MKIYEVKRDFALEGQIRRRGERVKLTDRGARNLLLGGFLSPAASENDTRPPRRRPVKKSMEQT